jgi:hypothetical protein
MSHAHQHEMNLLDLARSAAHAQCSPTRGEAVALNETARRWQVHFPKANPIEVMFAPEATRAEVASIYPGAVIEPLSEPPTGLVTQAQAAELRALIQSVAERDSWPAADLEEAIAVALAEVDAALVCFRELAAALPAAPVGLDDDRRTCRTCHELRASTGECRAARTMHIGTAGREYHPMPDLLRRCDGYKPRPSEVDQRTGAERWPEIAADTLRLRGTTG